MTSGIIIILNIKWSKHTYYVSLIVLSFAYFGMHKQFQIIFVWL